MTSLFSQFLALFQSQVISHLGVKLTLHPYLLCGPIRHCSVHGCSSLLSTLANSWIILTVTYAASVFTSYCAGHTLGPPPNGTKFQNGFKPSHLSGRNTSASGPQRSLSWWRQYILKLMYSPLRTSNGDLPSEPPPVGRILSARTQRGLSSEMEYMRWPMIVIGFWMAEARQGTV